MELNLIAFRIKVLKSINQMSGNQKKLSKHTMLLCEASKKKIIFISDFIAGYFPPVKDSNFKTTRRTIICM